MSPPERPRIWAPRSGQGASAPRRPSPEPPVRLPTRPALRGLRPDGRGGVEPEPLGAVAPSGEEPAPPVAGARPWFTLGIGAAAGSVAAVFVVVVLLLTGVLERDNTVVRREQAGPVAPRPGSEGSIVDIARRARPAMVTINLIGGGSGSGFIIQDDGHVITNEHVVAGESSVSVVLDSGRVVEGQVLGSDAETDVAVVKLDVTEPLPAVLLGTAENLEIGQLAIAIGSPLGLTGGPSVTVGVISALGRTVQVPGSADLLDMIQTDAPISPGSSGGALLDETGAVIGITTAVAVSEVGAEGLGFATPIDVARRVAEQIITTGRALHPSIGIQGRDLSQDRADELGVQGGALIEQVNIGTPAQQAGLRRGDVIITFDGRPVRSWDSLLIGLRSRAPGERVALVVVRGSERLTVTISLGSR